MDHTSRVLLITLVVLLVVALAFPMALGGLMGMNAMRGQSGAMPGSPWSMGLVMGLGGVAVVAFWAALIVGVVLLVRVLSGAQGRPTSAAPTTPLEILQRRYAAGEINDEQFERMQENLQGPLPLPAPEVPKTTPD